MILATIWSHMQFMVLASDIYLTEFAAGTNNMDSTGVILDTTGDICYVGQSHEAQLTVQLPISTLGKCFANLSKIVIKTRSGHVVSVGQNIMSDQDRGRWTLEFSFKHWNNSLYGTLTINLHIEDVMYRDSRNLYLEIRDEDRTYKTNVQEWNYVPDKSEAIDQGTNINHGKDGPMITHETDTDHEREVSTEEKTSSEDRSAILQAKVRALENELEMQNRLIFFQAKEIHDLEAKSNSSQTVKNPDGITGPNAREIASFCIGVVGALTVTVFLLVFFMKYGIVSTYSCMYTPPNRKLKVKVLPL